MLRNALFSLLILIVGKSYAQQDYFVLIQADNNQPFYVQLGDKSLSSTIKGRLILSQLKGGSHSITVGWPKQLVPEQQFTFNIDEKDLEFQLKDLGEEKGWGLFNPQTMELKAADRKKVTANSHSEGIKKDDAFSRLMAGVVSDTAVMYNTYAMEEALKVDTTATVSLPPASPKDSTATKPVPPAPHPTVRVLPGATSQTRSIGTVVKLSERKTPKGLRLAFADRPKGRKADTVIIIIPMDSLPVREVASNKPDTTRVRPTAKEEIALNKPDPASSVGELRRSKSDSVSVAAGPDSNQAPSTSGGALYRSKSDTGITLPSETIVQRNPDTIHVYISAGKKVIPVNADTTHTAAGKITPGNTDSARIPVVPAEAVFRSKADTVRTSAGKVTRNSPDSSRNSSASTRITPAPNRELFRSKPDSAQKGAATKPTVVNSDCRNFASDYDVDKLRVKMLEISKDEDRIQMANKIFKTKCFTTKQIKALSEVFTTDAGKYRFFEAAYPFVSDDHFRELTDVLTDPVYNGKFRVMTGQQ